MAQHEGDQGGRPEYIPTEADRNTVRSMSACGFSHESIARCIGTEGIHQETLRKHFRRELDTAMDMANARIGQVAFQKASEGEAWAVCFWLKCRAHWKEVQGIEHSGPGGGPIEHTSNAELLRSRIDRIAARAGTPEDPRESD